jgi:iron complex transport system substrate-binding protein
MSSRTALRGTAVLAAALVLAGCGGSDAGGNSSAEGSSAPSGSASSAFPVTVTTAFGAVEVPKEPVRVVALGWGDAETALALGVQPVGASDWLAFGGEGVGPWAADAYDQAPEIIDTLEPSYEAIAALKPDLILDTKSPATQERYDALSKIAPTIGQPEGVDPYLTTYSQQLDLIGQALGKTVQADAVAAQVDDAFAAAAAAHPEFAGVQVAVAAYGSTGFGAYVRGDGRVDFMEKLGFTNKPAIQDLATSSFFVPVSDEQLPLLDAGLTVAFPIFVDAAQITDNPLWQAIPSVQAGHSVVQSTLYALTTAVPRFAAAL